MMKDEDHSYWYVSTFVLKYPRLNVQCCLCCITVMLCRDCTLLREDEEYLKAENDWRLKLWSNTDCDDPLLFPPQISFFIVVIVLLRLSGWDWWLKWTHLTLVSVNMVLYICERKTRSHRSTLKLTWNKSINCLLSHHTAFILHFVWYWHQCFI